MKSRMLLRSSNLLALCLLGSGCGGNSEIASVSGTITLDGTPLAQASVTFQPDKGRPSHGGTDDKGFYTLTYSMQEKGAVIGPSTVRISTATEDADGKRRRESVPKRYFGEGGVKVQVENKNNKIDIALTSKEEGA